MPARTSDRDDECPECGCRVVNGCACDDDGEDPDRTQRGSVVVHLLAAIATLALLLLSHCVRPERIDFNVGALHGVQADGSYHLRRQNTSIDGDAQEGSLRGRIWCSGGTRAIAVSYRVVGCMRVEQ